MSRPDADRNLLFGITALQNDFITRDALINAMSAWALAKHRPIGEILVEAGALTPEDRNWLEGMFDRRLAKHNNDPAQGLAALSSAGPVAEDLRRSIADPDILASIDQMPSDPYATRAAEPVQPLPAGTRFRRLEKHAAGNLGVVYVARDEELNRTVALKEIKEGNADHPHNQAKFLLEAEVTGGLEHPGIVPVYGLGHYLDGRPYYAMRFIRGKSLLDSIKKFHGDESLGKDPGKRLLELQKLLRRFTDVCNAIAYAHSRGVLHRDLKPDNVMVGKYGETLVVDWGLAKALGESSLSGTEIDEEDPLPEGSFLPSKSDHLEATQVGKFVGTPAYASPEQSAGRLDLLGPASDIYGLGATLYHLIVGRHPVDGSNLAEIKSNIQTGRFARPRALAPWLDPALEAICLKAMALRPSDRYESPRALAEDIDRWLVDQPVTAYRDPWTRRARRWAKRNRTVVTGVAAAMLVGLVGLAALATERTRTGNVLALKNKELDRKNNDLLAANKAKDEQRLRAEKNETQAIAAVKKFGDVVANDPELKQNPRLQDLRKRLMNEPLQFFKALRERLQADKDTRPESLSRLASASFDLGLLSSEIGDKQDALIAYRESLAIQQKLADDNPTVTVFQSKLAARHNNIGNLLSHTGQPEAALKAYNAALAIRQKLIDDNPAVTQFQSDLATSHYNIGNLLRSTGQPESALKAHNVALLIRQKLTDDNPAVTQFQSDLAASYNSIGDLLSSTGQPEAALKAYNAALAIQQKLADANPAVTQFQSDLALSHNSIGLLLRSTGQPEAALKAYNAALAIQQKLVEDNPAVTQFQRDLAASHNNIGMPLSVTGQPEAALKAYNAALAIQQKLADANPTVTEFQSGLAACHNNIGNLLSSTGQPEAALKAYNAALAIRQKLAENNPTVTGFQSDLAASHNSIGNLLGVIGQPESALKAYNVALAIQQKLADANPAVTEFQSGLALSHYNIGNLLRSTGQPESALEAYNAALAIRQKLADANPAVTEFQSVLATSHNNIGALLSSTGQPEAGLKDFNMALAIRQKLADANPAVTQFQSDLALSHNNIGNLLRSTGQPEAAFEAFNAALTVQQKLAENHPEMPDFASNLGVTLHNLALIDLNAKRFASARESLRQAVVWQRKGLATNPANPTYRQYLKNHWGNLRNAAVGLNDAEGIVEADRELAALRDSDPVIVALDRRLTLILQGQEQPRNVGEALQLAQRAYDKGWHAASSRLSEGAFQAEPRAAALRNPQYRYNAACAASLGGCGQAKDDPAPDEAARIKLRGQALDWLKAELTAWSTIIEQGPPQAKALVVQALDHWKQDTDLAGIRDEEGLARLPEAEREAFRKLWEDVEVLRGKAGGR